MIKSIGLDLVETERLRKDVEKYGDRFLVKILGAQERTVYDQRADKDLFLAGRFAAKEAVVKALGAYLTDRPALTEIQILNDNSGQPILSLPESVQSRLHGARCMISITHEKKNAAAVAIFVEE